LKTTWRDKESQLGISSEFYPVAGDHLEVDGVEKKK